MQLPAFCKSSWAHHLRRTLHFPGFRDYGLGFHLLLIPLFRLPEGIQNASLAEAGFGRLTPDTKSIMNPKVPPKPPELQASQQQRLGQLCKDSTAQYRKMHYTRKQARSVRVCTTRRLYLHTPRRGFESVHPESATKAAPSNQHLHK